jgi:hypothetical protein
MKILVLELGQFGVDFFDVNFNPQHVIIAIYCIDYRVVQAVQFLQKIQLFPFKTNYKILRIVQYKS